MVNGDSYECFYIQRFVSYEAEVLYGRFVSYEAEVLYGCSAVIENEERFLTRVRF